MGNRDSSLNTLAARDITCQLRWISQKIRGRFDFDVLGICDLLVVTHAAATSEDDYNVLRHVLIGKRSTSIHVLCASHGGYLGFTLLYSTSQWNLCGTRSGATLFQ